MNIYVKCRSSIKNERLAQKKTQREWIRDIHISVSRYSEIENGVIKNGKKADIGSEQLILLLESNNVDVREFFSNLSKGSTSTKKLSLELSRAFNNWDAKRADKLRKKILMNSGASIKFEI